MRLSIGTMLGIALAIAILVALIADLALVAAHAVRPSLGWMLP